MDPYWAICSSPGYQYGGWERESFLATGQAEWAEIRQRAVALGHPEGRTEALDFGCGVGRVTRAIAADFDRCTGLDVSREMIEQAQVVNSGVAGCEFVTNPHPDLRLFDSGQFDLIYTAHVLQHVETRSDFLAWVAELVRVLRPGGLFVCHAPSALKLRHRLQPRRRVYGFLRAAGVPREVLYRRLRLDPIRMTFAPVSVMQQTIESSGGRVLAEDRAVSEQLTSSTYWVTR